MGLFRKLSKPNASQKIIDIHCHILPSLDDGASDMEETLKLLEIAAASGIKNIIATPHFKPGKFHPSKETIKESIKAVNHAASECNLDIKLHSGCEVFICDDNLKALKAGEVLTMNDTPYILAEFMPMSQFTLIGNMLYEVGSMGYTPIIAHIERYECFTHHPEYAKELKKCGYDIQVNSASVMGDAGKDAKNTARLLLRSGLVDYIATDAHRLNHRTTDISKCVQWVYKNLEPDYADDLLFSNAKNKLLINL